MLLDVVQMLREETRHAGQERAVSMKAYLTKNALVSGIEEVDISDECITFDLLTFEDRVYTKNEWHLDKCSAVAAAKEMRDARLDDLKAEVERLSQIEF